MADEYADAGYAVADRGRDGDDYAAGDEYRNADSDEYAGIGCPVFSDRPDRGRAPILICGPVWLGLLIPDDNREKTEKLGRPEELVCKRLTASVKNFRDAV